MRKDFIEQGKKEEPTNDSAMGIQSEFSHMNGEPSKERKYYSVERRNYFAI